MSHLKLVKSNPAKSLLKASIVLMSIVLVLMYIFFSGVSLFLMELK